LSERITVFFTLQLGISVIILYVYMITLEHKVLLLSYGNFLMTKRERWRSFVWEVRLQVIVPLWQFVRQGLNPIKLAYSQNRLLAGSINSQCL